MSEAAASGSTPDSQQFGRIVLGGRTAHLESSVGTLKLHPGGVGWKSRETGNVIAYSKGDIRGLEWIKIPHAYQLKLRAKGGLVQTFNGFKAQDKAAVEAHCATHLGQQLAETKLSYRGWNWGEAAVEGTHLHFKVEDETAFELPLTEITAAKVEGQKKNEAVIEVGGDDGTALPEDEILTEIRLHVPAVGATADDVDPELTAAEQFVESLQASGDFEKAGNAIAEFDDVQVQVPRGRYAVEMFDKHMHLRGKTYDYKVLYTNVASLYLLPKQDNFHMALCVTLEHPLRQGSTMYPHIVMQVTRPPTATATTSTHHHTATATTYLPPSDPPPSRPSRCSCRRRRRAR